MKRVIAIMLCAVTVSSLFSIGSYADTLIINESEDNNSIFDADIFQLDGVVNGTLESGQDKDCFKLEVTEKGYIEIFFSNSVLTNSLAGWRVSIYRQDDVLQNVHSHTVKANVTDTKLPKIGVEKGTYYIEISDGYYGYGYVSGVNYSVKTVFSKTEYWESECNNSYDTADKMKFGENYGGSIFNVNDLDHYSFTVEEKGYVEINFSNSVVPSDTAMWKAEVVKLTDGYDVIHSCFICAAESKTVFPKIGVTKGSYCIVISDGCDNYGDVNNVQYYISADFTASDSFESENNNSYASADEIKFGCIYEGYLYNENTADHYKFTADKQGYVNINFFNPLGTNSNQCWKLEVVKLGSSYETVYSQTVYMISQETNMPQIAVDPGTYYIVISDGYYNFGYVNNIIYSFTVDFSERENFDGEHNETYGNADTVLLTEIYGGCLNSSQNTNCYKFELDSRRVVDIVFSNSVLKQNGTVCILKLYRFSNGLIPVTEVNVSGDKLKTVINSITLEAGTYYVFVEDSCLDYKNENSFEYSLCVFDRNKYLYGDVDCDGTVTSADARTVLRRAVGLELSDDFKDILGDVDIDGSISSADARMVLRCAVGLEKLMSNEH